ncbi:hypothetical protein E1295_30160 [Nonomuraea mesophila]|uniref:Metalloprotease n=1 Tax=Nonomuraea mesophila TaxID=2530382 RepID=A0A4R5F1U5_9ACTN|nr:hypothetical protein E1295_30160 [Nonomuraea mesophila]
MYIGITQKRIDDPFEVYLAYFLGHEYTHHVQAMNGIFTKYYPAARAEAGENGKLELSRRLELQADCFSSAFVGSVRGTLPVKASDWKYLIDWKRENGGKHWPKNDHGQGTTQAYWMEKGFNTGCNTWTAPGKRVT